MGQGPEDIDRARRLLLKVTAYAAPAVLATVAGATERITATQDARHLKG